MAQARTSTLEERLAAFAAGLMVVLAVAIGVLGWHYWRQSRTEHERARATASTVAGIVLLDFVSLSLTEGYQVVLETFVPAFNPDSDDLAVTVQQMDVRARDWATRCRCTALEPSSILLFDPDGERAAEAIGPRYRPLGVERIKRIREFARGLSPEVRAIHMLGFGEGMDGEMTHVRLVRAASGRRVAAAITLPVAQFATRVFEPVRQEMLRKHFPHHAQPDSVLGIAVTFGSTTPVYQSPWHGNGVSASRVFWNDPAPLLTATLTINLPAWLQGAPRGIPPLALLIGGLLLLTLTGIGVFVLQRARMLMRARTLFFSGISHELRTPLTQVLMYAESLERGEMAPERRQRAQRIILREARRLVHMIENVLLLARGGGSRIPLNPVPTALGDVVNGTLEELEPLLERHRAALHTDVAAGVGAMIDAGAVRQVVVNLVDNALRYGPEGQTIRVTVRADDARAILTIRDEGPGIPPADRERVFEPFVRLAPGAATGAGIGLALVRQLARAMHGGVRIEDVAGPGLAISVWFPRAQLTNAFRSTRPHPEVEHSAP